jgi:hypothetical protein
MLLVAMPMIFLARSKRGETRDPDKGFPRGRARQYCRALCRPIGVGRCRRERSTRHIEPGRILYRVLSDSGPVPTVETSPGGPLVFEPAEPIQTSVTILAFSSITDSVEQRLVLLEPDGTFSDDVFVAVSPAFEGSQRVGFALNSDSSGIVFFLPVDFTTTETGDLQDVTHFFTILNGSGLVVQVQSHLEPVATEPASLLLLACGVGGLGWGSMSPPREVASR